jgi:hypothetical protein
MKTENFVKLIEGITGVKFHINGSDNELMPEKKYFIYKILPITQKQVGFDFKIPKNDETIIKSFITTFCNKYREPNPKNYDGKYYGSVAWNDKTEKEKEYCYSHHVANMFNKKDLLDKIKENLNTEVFENIYCKYGFYETIYGIGIFVLFSGIRELNAINKMNEFLKLNDIPFSNEHSKARWVYRFVLNINKEYHLDLLKKFNSNY